MSTAPSNSRAAYERFHARRASSPTLRQLQAEVCEHEGLASAESSVTRGELERLAALLGLGDRARLLDLGCGSGAPARYLAHTTGWRVVGLDLLPLRVRRADSAVRGQSSGGHAALFCVADMERGLPLRAGRFDAAMVLDTLAQVLDKRSLLLDIQRVLRPRGQLGICSVVGPELSAEERALIEEAPGTSHHQVTRAELLELLQQTGWRLGDGWDRREALVAVWQRRLRAMEAARAALERELGDSEADLLIRRGQAITRLFQEGRLDSVFITAEAAG